MTTTTEEETTLFLQVRPNYTAESTIHEQFLANAKSVNGTSNIKNTIIISLAALNEICHIDNSDATSPMTTGDTTTPLADPKHQYKILSRTSSEHTCGMKNDMKSSDLPHTFSSISTTPATILNNSTTNIQDNPIKQTNTPTTTNGTNSHTSPDPTLDMVSPTPPEHGIIVDVTIDKSNIFLARHATEYSTFISLQSKNQRKKFYVKYPLYGAEHALSNNYYYVRENIDDPYSELFARQKLVKDLEALQAQTEFTEKTLEHLRSYENPPSRIVPVPVPIYKPSTTDMAKLSATAFRYNPIGRNVTYTSSIHDVLHLAAYKEDHDGSITASEDMLDARHELHCFYDTWLSHHQELVRLLDNKDSTSVDLFIAKYPHCSYRIPHRALLLPTSFT